MVPEEVAGYGQDLAGRVLAVLGDDLVGAYFVGSIALGGYVPGESDIDVLAVSASPVPEDLKAPLAESLLDPGMACPARGLEFNLYRRAIVAAPPGGGADFELSINGGPRMERKVRGDPGGQPGFWYVLDRAIARRFGVPIIGPPPAEVVANVDRTRLLGCMAESMRWHRQHEGATLYSVLTASRALHLRTRESWGPSLRAPPGPRPGGAVPK